MLGYQLRTMLATEATEATEEGIQQILSSLASPDEAQKITAITNLQKRSAEVGLAVLLAQIDALVLLEHGAFAITLHRVAEDLRSEAKECAGEYDSFKYSSSRHGYEGMNLKGSDYTELRISWEKSKERYEFVKLIAARVSGENEIVILPGADGEDGKGEDANLRGNIRRVFVSANRAARIAENAPSEEEKAKAEEALITEKATWLSVPANKKNEEKWQKKRRELRYLRNYSKSRQRHAASTIKALAEADWDRVTGAGLQEV